MKHKKQILLSPLILFLIIWIVYFFNTLNLQLHARDLVGNVSGYWSEEPGWPGGEIVGLETDMCSVLDESVILNIVVSLEHNPALNYLSLEGQKITKDIAIAIGKLDNIETLDLIKCDINEAVIREILTIKSIKQIFIDSNSKPIYDVVASELGVSYKIHDRQVD